LVGSFGAAITVEAPVSEVNPVRGRVQRCPSVFPALADRMHVCRKKTAIVLPPAGHQEEKPVERRPNR
jgi:hypothetical protein